MKLETGRFHEHKWRNCPHQSKINGFNNQWDFKKDNFLRVGVPSRQCAVHACLQVRPDFLELCIARGSILYGVSGIGRDLSRSDFDLLPRPFIGLTEDFQSG